MNHLNLIIFLQEVLRPLCKDLYKLLRIEDK